MVLPASEAAVRTDRTGTSDAAATAGSTDGVSEPLLLLRLLDADRPVAQGLPGSGVRWLLPRLPSPLLLRQLLPPLLQPLLPPLLLLLPLLLPELPKMLPRAAIVSSTCVDGITCFP